MKLLVTGGCGFIGSTYIRHLLEGDAKVEIVNLDALTYAGNPDNAADFEQDGRYALVHGDITDAATVAKAMDGCQQVVHFAAESHVDRSITGPAVFTTTNVLGTQVLLEQARQQQLERFVHISTDEVYGSLGPTGFFTEDSLLQPNSPYSASKAGSDLVARAYHETYGLPVIITRCSNNYGPYQSPEKLIPVLITKALADEPLPIYGDGGNIRDWIHALDHCRGVETARQLGKPGQVYNLGGHQERTNVDIAKSILELLGKPESLISFVEDRPGHDRRYAIDPGKAQAELNWQPQYEFEKGLAETVRWYQDNPQWIERAAARLHEAQ